MRKNPHAVALGRKKSDHKAATARANGKLGGRPRKVAQVVTTRSGPMSLSNRVAIAALLKAVHENLTSLRGNIAIDDPLGGMIGRVRLESSAAFHSLTGRDPGDVLASDLDPNHPAPWVAREIRTVRGVARV